MLAGKIPGPVLALADQAAGRARPGSLRWMWGDALFLWSLTELDAFLGEDRYLPLVRAWCGRFGPGPGQTLPRVDQSDTCAPGLVTWALYRRTKDPGALTLTGRVVDYLVGEPRLVGEAVNHLGHSPEGRLYPRSIWVDSLMMFGVLAASYGVGSGNRDLLGFAARQPGLYASLLQDQATGLFRHAWWAGRGEAYPPQPLFWARGNAWVVAALPRILDCLGEGHPEAPAIRGVLESVAAALLSRQRPDAWWDTLLGSPGRNYREASATALIAAGFLHASRQAWLPRPYAEAGLRAYASLVEALATPGRPDRAPRLPEVSAPTIPLPLFPRSGYSLVPRRPDLPYGLAGLFLAAIEAARHEGYAPPP